MEAREQDGLGSRLQARGKLRRCIQLLNHSRKPERA